MASRATVAAGHPETAEAAASVLRDGGNAVDACVAAVLASFVSEIGLTGPFGGGFALVASPDGSSTSFDFFADVPGRGLSDTHGIEFNGVDVSFGPTTQTFHVGRGSVAMSSVLQGLMALHEKFGTKPLNVVAAPAQELARQGTRLTEQTTQTMGILEPILRYTLESSALFAPTGTLPVTGARLANPELCSLFAELSQTRVDRLNGSFASCFAPPLGLVTAEDLSAYRVLERQPLSIQIRDYTVELNPPPSSGGALVGFGLRLLERVDPSVWEDPAQTMVHLLAAMSTTLRARVEELDGALAQHGTVEVNGMILDDGFIDSWWPVFERAVRRGPGEAPSEGRPTPGNTTHVSVVDANGWACTLTSSNGEGCGIAVPGSGAVGNNFLGESDLNPGGFHSSPAGVRLTSMMCPVVVSQDSVPLFALGSGGSNRIRTALLQVLTRTLLCGEPIQQAVDRPRIHFEHDTLYLEKRNGAFEQPAGWLDKVQCPRQVIFEEPSMFFGGVHVAGAQGAAAGDPRRQGSVAVV
ncbi:MAG: gamma-glutamyltransferase [Myxococcota bacterium]